MFGNINDFFFEFLYFDFKFETSNPKTPSFIDVLYFLITQFCVILQFFISYAVINFWN